MNKNEEMKMMDGIDGFETAVRDAVELAGVAVVESAFTSVIARIKNEKADEARQKILEIAKASGISESDIAVMFTAVKEEKKTGRGGKKGYMVFEINGSTHAVYRSVGGKKPKEIIAAIEAGDTIENMIKRGDELPEHIKKTLVEKAGQNVEILDI